MPIIACPAVQLSDEFIAGAGLLWQNRRHDFASSGSITDAAGE